MSNKTFRSITTAGVFHLMRLTVKFDTFFYENASILVFRYTHHARHIIDHITNMLVLVVGLNMLASR